MPSMTPRAWSAHLRPILIARGSVWPGAPCGDALARQQPSEPHQVVGGECHRETLGDSPLSPMPPPAQATDCLRPAPGFLEPFAPALAHLEVALPLSRTGAAARRGLGRVTARGRAPNRDVRHDRVAVLQRPQKRPRVVALVGTQRPRPEPPVPAPQVRQQCQGGWPLDPTQRRRHARGDAEARIAAWPCPLQAKRASGSVIERCVRFERRSPRKFTYGLPGSSSGAASATVVSRSASGLTRFIEAHACSNVPSTLKCSALTKPSSIAWRTTPSKNRCKRSPSAKRSRFLVNVVASHTGASRRRSRNQR